MSLGNSFYFNWEPALMTLIQQGLGDTAVSIMSVITMLGEEYVMVAIFAFVYFCWDKKAGVFIGTNLMVNLTLNPMIKNIFLRRRPYMDHESVKCLKPVDNKADIYDISAQGYSFPSGHSNNSVTFYGSIAAALKKRWMIIAAVLLALLIGFSRVAVGVHYPTDVLAGWAVGIAIIFVMSFLQEKIQKKWILYLALLVLAAPGWFYCRSNDYFNGFGMMTGFFAGVLFEEKYVQFRETRTWYRMVLRVVLGGAIFLGLNTLLKLPFPKSLLESATMPQYIIRCCRYAIVVFVMTGVYPLLFRILDRREEKKKQH